MSGAPLWLIIVTVSAYAAFAIGFGEEVFSPFDGECSGIIDCATAIFSLIGDAQQFIYLGGFSGLLPPLIQIPLLLVIGVGWAFVLADVILP